MTFFPSELHGCLKKAVKNLRTIVECAKTASWKDLSGRHIYQISLRIDKCRRYKLS